MAAVQVHRAFSSRATRLVRIEAGNSAIPSSVSGIRLFNANDTTIGGTVPGTGNLISGNTVDGLQVQNSSSGTVIEGNIIGLDAGGTVAIPNTNYGIETLFGATGTVIDNNLISGNAFYGISLGNSSLNSLVQGNLIGTDFTGNRGSGQQSGGHLDRDLGPEHDRRLRPGARKRDLVQTRAAGVLRSRKLEQPHSRQPDWHQQHRHFAAAEFSTRNQRAGRRSDQRGVW